MTRVIIQAGHSAAFPPFASPGGGAPGEAAWATDLATRLADRLRAAGVDVDVVGAWFVTRNGQPVVLAPPAAATSDADLFVSLHYDAPTKHDGAWDASGCFADRAPLDPAGERADHFIALWESIYPAATGIGLDVYRGIANPNTDRYYAFNATSPNTPGVLIEHGCGSLVPVGEYPAGDDAQFLRDQLDVVVDADTSAILSFLGITAAPVVVDDPPAAPADPCAEPNAIKGQFEAFVRELQPRQSPRVTKLKRDAKRAGQSWADHLIYLGRGY